MATKSLSICLQSSEPGARWIPAWQRTLQEAGHPVRVAERPGDFADALLVVVDEDSLETMAASDGTSPVPFVVLLKVCDGAALARAAAAGSLGCLPMAASPGLVFPFVATWTHRLGKLHSMQREHSLLLESLSEARTVGAGMGVLIERHGLEPDAALQALRRHARRHRRKLVDLVADVTAGDVFPAGQPPDG